MDLLEPVGKQLKYWKPWHCDQELELVQGLIHVVQVHPASRWQGPGCLR